jgi:hypothetical protein
VDQLDQILRRRSDPRGLVLLAVFTVVVVHVVVVVVEDGLEVDVVALANVDLLLRGRHRRRRQGNRERPENKTLILYGKTQLWF